MTRHRETAAEAICSRRRSRASPGRLADRQRDRAQHGHDRRLDRVRRSRPRTIRRRWSPRRRRSRSPAPTGRRSCRPRVLRRLVHDRARARRARHRGPPAPRAAGGAGATSSMRASPATTRPPRRPSARCAAGSGARRGRRLRADAVRDDDADAASHAGRRRRRRSSSAAGELLTRVADPLDDVRGSAEYRRLLIPRLLLRAVRRARSAAPKHEREHPCSAALDTLNVERSTAQRRRRAGCRHAADRAARRLQLTGAKRGCNQGVCGACTVADRRRPMRACLSLGARLRRRRGDARSKAARARRACRRCSARSRTPAPSSAASARPACWSRRMRCCAENPQPDDAAVRGALSGNLCRCTGYVQDRRRGACARLARRRRGMSALVGTAVGAGAARSRATKAQRPRAVHRRPVPPRHAARRDPAEPACPCAHPRLRPERGAGAAGRARHRHRRRCRRAPPHGRRSSRTSRRWPRARCATSARSSPRWRPTPRRIARAAARLISVDYEELPAVLDPAAALAPGAPLRARGARTATSSVFDAGTRRQPLLAHRVPRGRRRARLGASATSSSKATFQTQAQAHLSLEPCGALAEVDAGGPRDAVVGQPVGVPRPGQRLRIARPADDAAALPDAARRRRLRQQDGVARAAGRWCMLAMKARRTVKLILSREEDFETVRARHPITIRMKTGARRDGTLVAREIELLLDGGAYGDDSPGVLGYALLMSCGPVQHPARARARPGRVHEQAALRRVPRLRRAAGDVRVGTAARRDRAARWAWTRSRCAAATCKRPGDTWFGGQAILSNGLAECLDSGRARIGLARRARRVATSARRPSAARGCGVACRAHISGLLASGAIVRMLEDGSVLLNTGAVDIGQGINTALTQICAEALQGADGARGDRQPRHRRLAVQLGHHREPRDLRHRPLGGRRRRPRSSSKLKEHAARDARMLRRRSRAAARRQGRRSRACRQQAVSFARHLRPRALGRRRADHRHATAGCSTRRRSIPSAPSRSACRSTQIGIFSFSAMVVEVEVDEATGKVRVLRRLVGLRRRPGHQSRRWRAARSRARSCRAWATR